MNKLLLFFQTGKNKYFVLLLRPTILGTLGVVAWYFIHPYIKFVNEDQGIFEPLLGIIGIAHGVTASLQIQKVADQHNAIQQALHTKNRKLFLQTQCLRINPVIKLLLLVFSMIFFGIFLFYPFRSIYTGSIVVWTTMFVLYLLWEVAAELDDPYHGIWKLDMQKVKEILGDDIEKEINIKI